MALFVAAAASLINWQGAGAANAGSTRSGGHPVVVELFTSQGCYSCPPADRFIGELKGRADVIALAFHIDYWDYIGWKDPFAIPAHTARQRSYGKTLGLWSIYTPQMVIDGRLEGVGSRTSEISEKIDQVNAMSLAERVSIPVSVTLSTTSAGQRLSVEIEGGAAPKDGEIWLIAYDDSHTTPITRGENAGKTLVGHNIVRDIRRLGGWNGAPVAANFDTRNWSIKADNAVVLLQEKNQGAIYGAAMIKLQ